jgi:hypothetical protein
MKRVGAVILTLAILVALVVSIGSYRSVTDIQRAGVLTSVSILESIASQLDAQTALRTELGGAKFTAAATSAQGAYLSKIRQDGMRAHSEMRHKLGSLSKSNVAILTLLDLYEPYAQTEAFKAEARAFRSYAIAWNDRWDSVMEYFMAGGNLPVSDVPFPDGFRAAVEAEKQVVAN